MPPPVALVGPPPPTEGGGFQTAGGGCLEEFGGGPAAEVDDGCGVFCLELDPEWLLLFWALGSKAERCRMNCTSWEYSPHF